MLDGETERVEDGQNSTYMTEACLDFAKVRERARHLDCLLDSAKEWLQKSRFIFSNSTKQVHQRIFGGTFP